MRVRDYGAKGASGRPVIFVPSLINPAHILDLSAEASLLGWLAARGVRPLLVDWGTPAQHERSMDLTQHVEMLLLPLIARITDHFGEPPVLAGYCLGGTLALAAACAVPVAGLALIATPWHFAGFGRARSEIAALWNAAKPACEAMGLVPIEVLQSGFWRLDPGKTVAKYEAFARIEPGSAKQTAFIALEDWANGGAPLPYGAGRQLMEEFIAADLPGSGAWQIAGVTADPARLTCPAIDFVSRHDRIVPAASAADLADRHDVAAGHVGMIVGSRRHAELWEPLADWLTTLPRPK
ncbi:alpha/beta fold hydrolase [Sphingomonas sp. GC_Shp_3]|uniref:alpha/beta fold hydrolase n=1 Tax=Sphingomonas sp. GC_Shp_3 TaxID=2937383 RepID=UPI003211C921